MMLLADEYRRGYLLALLEAGGLRRSYTRAANAVRARRGYLSPGERRAIERGYVAGLIARERLAR